MPNAASVVAILLSSSLSCPAAWAQCAAKAPNPAASAEREQALGRIRALAGKIEKISDDRARLAGLSLLGDIVCKEDPDLARDSFRKAAAIAQQLEGERKPLPQPAKAGLPPQPDRTWATLLQRVARCDADLALELRKQTEEKIDPLAGSQADMETAMRLVREDLDSARKFAERSLDAPMDERTAQSVFYLLYGFRRQNPEVADALFARALANLAAQLRAESYNFMLFGNYIFGPPFQGEHAATSMGFVMIGGVGVPNLTANRPWTTTALARPFIETGISILSRPVTDSRQVRQDYAAAYQLRPKALEFAPDLVPLIDALVQRLSTQVPAEMAQGKDMNRLAEMRVTNIDEDIQEYEKTDAASRRPESQLMLFARLWQGKRYDRARALAKDVGEIAVRDEMLRLVDFAEAMRAVERGELSHASQAAAKWSDSLKRTLAFAAVAAAYLGQKEKDRATAGFLEAIREARLVEPRLRSPILIAIAGAQAELDTESALAALRQAAASNNEISPEERAWKPRVATGPRVPPIERLPSQTGKALITTRADGLWELLKLGAARSMFPLGAKGLGVYDFTPALMKKFGAHAADAEALASDLADETSRAQALACVVAAYLESLTTGKSTVQRE